MGTRSRVNEFRMYSELSLPRQQTFFRSRPAGRIWTLPPMMFAELLDAFFTYRYRAPWGIESQRDSTSKPKVARHELPWEILLGMGSTPTEVVSCLRDTIP